MKYSQIAQMVFNQPHAILPEKLSDIAGLVELRERGQSMSEAEIKAIVPKSEELTPYCLSEAGERIEVEAMASKSHGGGLIAVMPLFGSIFQHAGMMQMISGGTSTERFGNQFQDLLHSPDVSTIIIKGNTPGGSVFGVEELSAQIHAGRKSGKRIVAVADSVIASAGTWIATAAHEVVVTTGGEIGSIGVISMYADRSQQESEAGVARTIVRTPQNKARFTGVEPMDDDMMKTMVGRNEEAYDRFVRAVARNRGVSLSKVKDDFGGGEMLTAKEAVTVGLADRVATFRDVIAEERERIAGGRKRSAQRRANENRLRLAELA